VTDDKPDHGLEPLLNLDGWTDAVGGGFWISVKAFSITPDKLRPQGINYALSMHRKGGGRIVGYDNAHYPKIGSGPGRKAQRIGRGADHRHYRDVISWYDFESAGKLMEDFWKDVQAILKEESVPWT
jgi:hypothetical protein